MPNASIAPHPADATIDPREAAHFGALAADWWDPKGASAMLHRMNPARLRYIRERIDALWGGNGQGFAPLEGKTALDVGCGGGLVAEPLARMGARVTGIDAAAEAIAVARAHAAGQGLSIDYRVGGIEAARGPFDLITALEVIEHSADPAAFVAGLAKALAPDGLLIMSTPNRTMFSRVAMIAIGEGAGLIPRGTHDWSKFLTPDELTGLLEAAGLAVIDVSGFVVSLAKGFSVSSNPALDYLVAAGHRR